MPFIVSSEAKHARKLDVTDIYAVNGRISAIRLLQTRNLCGLSVFGGENTAQNACCSVLAMISSCRSRPMSMK